MPMGVLRVGGPRAGHAMHKSWYAPTRGPSYLATADRMMQDATAAGTVIAWTVMADQAIADGVDAAALTSRAGADWAQAVGAAQPEFQHRGLNGRAAIDCQTGEWMDGVHDWTGTDRAIVAVTVVYGAAGVDRDVYAGHVNASTRVPIQGRLAPGTSVQHLDGARYEIRTSTTGVNPMVQAGTWDQDGATLVDWMKLYENGVAIAHSSTIGAAVAGDFAASADASLGARHAARPVEGVISEVMLVKGAIVDMEASAQTITAAMRYRAGI